MELPEPIDYAAVFDATTVAIWIEDCTEAIAELRRMRHSGIEDVEAALYADAELAVRVASLVQVIAVNQESVRMFGATSPADLFGNLDRVFVPESLDLFIRILSRISRGERRVQESGVNARLNGEVFDIELTAVITGDPPDYSRAVVTLRDTTEHTALTAKLERTSDFLDTIVESIPHMIFVKEAKDLRFVRFNRAGEQLLGLPREDLYGKSARDLFPKEQADFFIDNDRRVLASGKVLNISEEPIDTPHGQRWLHTKKVPVYDSEGAPVYLLGISEDVSLLRATREQLAERTRDLERSNRELQEFAYVASHDLNEPLRTIRGFADVLVEELGPTASPQIQQILAFLSSGADRMRLLIDGLLALSRAGGKAHEVQAVDLGEVCDAVTASLAAAIRAAGADVSRGPLPTVACDALLIERVFQNLIENALKFRGPDRPPTVRIDCEQRDGLAFVTVRDNGIGFEQRFADRMFQVFGRLNARDEYAGAGIGLSISKRIIEDHRGEITATGSPGDGAAFTFSLPHSP